MCSGCWLAATGPARPASATSRSSCWWPGWGCGRLRWPGLSWATSTGGPEIPGHRHQARRGRPRRLASTVHDRSVAAISRRSHLSTRLQRRLPCLVSTAVVDRSDREPTDGLYLLNTTMAFFADLTPYTYRRGRLAAGSLLPRRAMARPAPDQRGVAGRRPPVPDRRGAGRAACLPGRTSQGQGSTNPRLPLLPALLAQPPRRHPGTGTPGPDPTRERRVSGQGLRRRLRRTPARTPLHQRAQLPTVGSSTTSFWWCEPLARTRMSSRHSPPAAWISSPRWRFSRSW
jgi:hypothetical protein